MWCDSQQIPTAAQVFIPSHGHRGSSNKCFWGCQVPQVPTESLIPGREGYMRYYMLHSTPQGPMPSTTYGPISGVIKCKGQRDHLLCSRIPHTSLPLYLWFVCRGTASQFMSRHRWSVNSGPRWQPKLLPGTPALWSFHTRTNSQACLMTCRHKLIQLTGFKTNRMSSGKRSPQVWGFSEKNADMQGRGQRKAW